MNKIISEYDEVKKILIKHDVLHKDIDQLDDEKVEKWIENCPEHDTEILHTDEDGIVLVVRFNNKKED